MSHPSSCGLRPGTVYLISHAQEPGPESVFRLLPLWQTVELTRGRTIGLPWRCSDWAYWLENVAAKSCSTRPRVVSGVQPDRATATRAAALAAPVRRSRRVIVVSASRDVA